MCRHMHGINIIGPTEPLELQGCSQKIFWGFQWFKNHKAGGQGAQPPDAVGFIHSQTAFVAIFWVS